MAISEKCNAKDRSKCRFHGALDHAGFAVEEAKTRLQEVLEAYNNADPATRDLPQSRYTRYSALQNAIANARASLRKKQAVLDSFPTELKKLRTIAERTTQNKGIDSAESKELWGRVTRAEGLKAKEAAKAKEEKAAAKAEEALRKRNESLFEQISREVEEKENNTALGSPDSWKIGYQRAISAVIAEQGSIIDGPGHSSYGMYFKKQNHEKTAHFRECGTLDIRNVEEDSWDEYDFNSMDSHQTSHVEYKVTADATCKCGHLVSEKIEVSSNLSDIISSVLKF